MDGFTMVNICSCVKPLLSHVWSYVFNEAYYIWSLEKNLAALEKATNALSLRRADVLRSVQRKESEGLQRLNRVQGWLTEVEDIQNQVYELLHPRTDELEKLCLCGLCSKHLKESYDYGKSVFEMLTEIKDLESRGNFMVVAEQPTIPVGVEMPLQPYIFGQDKLLERAWEHLMNDKTLIMGLYGMGGVGKTTLLEQINNKFGANDGLDKVIYIVVSSELRAEKIQDEIAKRLGFIDEDWKKKDRGQKTTDIFTRMKNMKFVLLLDDIWTEVDLKDIGVPSPTKENRCKVVFTTRSREVCGHMGVHDPIEVTCLDHTEAWKLFRYRVGTTIESDTAILDRAFIVVRKCYGLPLALNIIGKNMACKTTVREWDQAIENLASSAADFPGMENDIFKILLCSYNDLRGEHVKSCFQYCALFPEDFSIEKEKLIDYWICEGFIDKKQDLWKAKNKAHAILGTLVRACLLIEEGENKSKVKMHDVVREMALWIASDFGKDKERCIVQAGVGLREVPTIEDPSSVRRMSLMENYIRKVSDSPNCPELTTLLFQMNAIDNISGEFFKSMGKLVVLDLSGNSFFNNELPEEISALASLQFLDLSNSGIQRLNEGLLLLKKLIYLNLESTKLESVSKISNLSRLRTLLLGKSFPWDRKMARDINVMKELQLLNHLEVVTIDIGSNSVANQLLNASRVVKAIQEIYISNLKKEEILAFPNMAVLSKLEIFGSKMSGIKIERGTSSRNTTPTPPAFPNLSSVSVISCVGLKDLTWLLFAPNLKVLKVALSVSIEDIISKGETENIFTEEEASTIIPFPKLEHFQMYGMPSLNSIYWSALPFQCLRIFSIERCPNLRKLPLNSKSGSSIPGEELVIHSREEDWLNKVEWEDEATKERFLLPIQPGPVQWGGQPGR